MRIIIYIIMSLLPTFASAWEVVKHDDEQSYMFGGHNKLLYIYRPAELVGWAGSEGDPVITHVKGTTSYINGQGYQPPYITADNFNWKGSTYIPVHAYDRAKEADLGVNHGCFILQAGDYVRFSDTSITGIGTDFAGATDVLVSEKSCKGAETSIFAADVCIGTRFDIVPGDVVFNFTDARTVVAASAGYELDYNMVGFTRFNVVNTIHSNIPELSLSYGSTNEVNAHDGKYAYTYSNIVMTSITGETITDIMFRHPDTPLITFRLTPNCLP